MKIVFLGTGAFGIPTLRGLVASGHAPRLVVSQPDRPSGRHRALSAPPLAAEAKGLGLPLFQPEKLRSPDAFARLSAEEPDLIIVIAYGQLLRPNVLALPRHGCWNLHGSLLPRHRGASPVQAALLHGDRETGVTLMLLDEGLDTGPILMQDVTPVRDGENAGELHDRLADLGAPLVQNGLRALAEGRLNPVPQDSRVATTCGLIRKEDGILDWTRPAVELDRMVRAYSPWPGATTAFRIRDGLLRVAVEASEVVPGQGGRPGAILMAERDGLIIQAGESALRVHRLKPAGKKSLDAASFLRGYPLEGGVLAVGRAALGTGGP